MRQTPDALRASDRSVVEGGRKGERNDGPTSVTLGLFLNFSLRCLLF